MADHPILAEIVLKLGTPPEPLGWREYLVACAMVAALAAYLAFEFGVGRLLSWLFAHMREDTRPSNDPPADEL